MLLTILILAAVLPAAVGICVGYSRGTGGLVGIVGTLLVIVSLVYSAVHGVLTSDD
jgi:hypothetical protein